MKFFKKSIFALNVVLVVALILAYLSPYFDPNNYWIFSIFGLFYPIILIGNLFMILLWLFVDFKYLFLSLFVVFLGWPHLQGFINFSGNGEGSPELKILSYNMGYGYSLRSGSKEAREAKKEELKSFFLSQSDVDVFCLQESSSFSRKILKRGYKDYYTHEIDRRGTFIFSKYPILRHGEISFGTSTNSCLWADINFKEDTIRIYNMHLQSNRVSHDAVKVIDNVKLQEKKTWEGVKGILRKYSSASKIRAEQSQKVADHAATCSHPTIICGDGNDSPTSFTYNRISERYQDSFTEAGLGIGTTYAGKIPMLRIDYIFVDDKFQVNTFDILTEDFSDHYAIKGGYTITRK